MVRSNMTLMPVISCRKPELGALKHHYDCQRVRRPVQSSLGLPGLSGQQARPKAPSLFWQQNACTAMHQNGGDQKHPKQVLQSRDHVEKEKKGADRFLPIGSTLVTI